jgi:uncharacterized metal-binding protein YceD (DUF177 family)
MTRPHAEPPPAHGYRRLVPAARVGDNGLAQRLEANDAERERIARYLGLIGLTAMTADVQLAHWRGKGLRVTGTLDADVVQACVVTLDPVPAHLSVAFERRFLPEIALSADEHAQHEVFVDPEGEEPPEPLGREVDLGEILVEELSLALDPYPRKPGVDFHGEDTAPRENPFAALAKLKPKLVKKDG